jgi:hypothetical protein
VRHLAVRQPLCCLAPTSIEVGRSRGRFRRTERWRRLEAPRTTVEVSIPNANLPVGRQRRRASSPRAAPRHHFIFSRTEVGADSQKLPLLIFLLVCSMQLAGLHRHPDLPHAWRQCGVNGVRWGRHPHPPWSPARASLTLFAAPHQARSQRDRGAAVGHPPAFPDGSPDSHESPDQSQRDSDRRSTFNINSSVPTVRYTPTVQWLAPG